MNWLAKIPYAALVPIAILLALAPFGARPHLVEKLRMLFSGTLRRPLDWLDLILHATPLVVLLMKVLAGLFAAKR